MGVLKGFKYVPDELPGVFEEDVAGDGFSRGAGGSGRLKRSAWPKPVVTGVRPEAVVAAGVASGGGADGAAAAAAVVAGDRLLGEG